MTTVIRRVRLSFGRLAQLTAPVLLAVGLFALGTGGASALTCPDEAGTFTASFTVNATPTNTVSCHLGAVDLWGGGNLNGSDGDAVGAAGEAAFGTSFNFLEKDNAPSGNPSNAAGILRINGYTDVPDVTPPKHTFTMNFSIVGTYTNLVLAIIGGGGQNTPRWAAFLLPPDVTGGTITLYAQNEISHINLYGTLAAVPVPAGIALGASALGLLGFMGWRRKKTVAA